ncbi:hypothetical protein ACM46_20560 [Chryseobacterium angstadtii]|uniref:Uncharacterized protein n=1 Tax=Chryseobacterium angstadtii TaxID=558151 RepID=A0A0J7HZ25_9FLAO|nr:hypothetical protein [Chryseobacterium angstadtii]KMQ59483.1 hypothetical protein ACM46_20560 [Chryseobacterium angstadtii]
MNVQSNMRLLFLFSVFTIILSCKTNDSFGLKKMNKNERNNFISSNLKTKTGVDLGNFIYQLQESKIRLKPFEPLLIEKLRGSEYVYDINILTNLLIEDIENKPEIEQVLNSKIKIWDTRNWSGKFWSLIQEYHLNIEKPNYYTIEANSLKKYDVMEFMKTKIATSELGNDPLLMVNWEIINYEKGKLIETLNKLDITQIDYTPKSKSVSIYGKRGIDGILNVTAY